VRTMNEMTLQEQKDEFLRWYLPKFFETIQNLNAEGWRAYSAMAEEGLGWVPPAMKERSH
jgi:hypothetical protein